MLLRMCVSVLVVFLVFHESLSSSAATELSLELCILLLLVAVIQQQ